MNETAFIELPLSIYAGTPYHVPWFHSSMRSIIARRHPYFEHSDGEFFIARRLKERSTPLRVGESGRVDGGPDHRRAVGRIALLEPRRYNEIHGRREARFYFFESVDDAEVATALFDHAERWAARRGLTELVGPQGFSSFSGAGILVHGFDQWAAMTMMPYHHAYYRRLVEGAGFAPYRDFHSAWIDGARYDRSTRYERVARIAMKRGRFHIPEYRTKRQVRAVAEEIRQAYNDAWRDRDVFTPLSKAELDQIVGDLLMVSRPSLVRLLRAGDEIAGFILAFPDVSEALAKARGRLTIVSMARLLLAKRTTRRFIINGFGIRPDYRKSGGTALLFHEITRVLREHGAQAAEMTQIAADNDLMMANVERLGAEIYKTHRVYRKRV